uniref:Uncharacterized protein n=1 Tax=Neisseria meningitidis alpha153 TaxID=663926 RepID=C6SDT3_NEIME|nr:hypothetical protein predicted by Glimmer/Critica [Neisseria meningitidis alpha153]
MPSETRSDGILQPIKIVGSNKISRVVIPAKSGNLETKNYRDLSETTTLSAVIPAKAGI